MPRYFFKTEDGQVHRDQDGTELSGLSAARVHAIRYAGDVMSNEPDVLWDGNEFHVEVSDEKGALLFTIICHAQNAPAGGDTK